MNRFDEMGADNISIPSIDDDDVLLYKRFIGEEHEDPPYENNSLQLRNKVKSNPQPNHSNNIKRREFGQVIEEVILNEDDALSSDSERYISPRENKYLNEVNQLLGKAKAERENSPKKQTPDSARFLSKIKKSLEDNLDDVIEESARLLKEALPMYSYETKQGVKENFSDLVKKQSTPSQKKDYPSALALNFDDMPMMPISKPINEFPYHSSEYRNYEVFEAKKNKKLLMDKDHDDVSTKFFPHLHETIQRSTPLKNKRLKSNIVKTSKNKMRDDNEYYVKSTEILPNNVENRHVYEVDEDPSPKKETLTEKPKIQQVEEKQTVQNIKEFETPLVFEYIKPNRELYFASPSSPVEPEEPEEPIQIESPLVVNSDGSSDALEESYASEQLDQVQDGKDTNEESNTTQTVHGSHLAPQEESMEWKESSIEELDNFPSSISKDLEHVGFQDIIRELNFTTESILRSYSSISNIEQVLAIPQEETQTGLASPEPKTPKAVIYEDPSASFSPMIYDQYSPNMPQNSPLQITPIAFPRKKIDSSNINKKKNTSTPRDQSNGPLEESFIPYSGVRHLQQTSYNHSTIDWYLNLCSNKYSRTPNTNNNNEKGVVKWV